MNNDSNSEMENISLANKKGGWWAFLFSSSAKSILLTLLSLRCNVIVGRIDLESGRSVAKERGLYFLPAVHILLSSLDGFDMAHILEKSGGSGNSSNQSPPLSSLPPPHLNKTNRSVGLFWGRGYDGLVLEVSDVSWWPPLEFWLMVSQSWSQKHWR